MDSLTFEHLQKVADHLRKHQVPGPYIVHTPYGLVSLNEDDTIAHGSDEAIQWLLGQKKTTQPTPINMQPETHAKPLKRQPGMTVMDEIRLLTMWKVAKRLK